MAPAHSKMICIGSFMPSLGLALSMKPNMTMNSNVATFFKKHEGVLMLDILKILQHIERECKKSPGSTPQQIREKLWSSQIRPYLGSQGIDESMNPNVGKSLTDDICMFLEMKSLITKNYVLAAEKMGPWKRDLDEQHEELAKKRGSTITTNVMSCYLGARTHYNKFFLKKCTEWMKHLRAIKGTVKAIKEAIVKQVKMRDGDVNKRKERNKIETMINTLPVEQKLKDSLQKFWREMGQQAYVKAFKQYKLKERKAAMEKIARECFDKGLNLDESLVNLWADRDLQEKLDEVAEDEFKKIYLEVKGRHERRQQLAQQKSVLPKVKKVISKVSKQNLLTNVTKVDSKKVLLGQQQQQTVNEKPVSKAPNKNISETDRDWMRRFWNCKAPFCVELLSKYGTLDVVKALPVEDFNKLLNDLKVENILFFSKQTKKRCPSYSPFWQLLTTEKEKLSSQKFLAKWEEPADFVRHLTLTSSSLETKKLKLPEKFDLGFWCSRSFWESPIETRLESVGTLKDLLKEKLKDPKFQKLKKANKKNIEDLIKKVEDMETKFGTQLLLGQQQQQTVNEKVSKAPNKNISKTDWNCDQIKKEIGILADITIHNKLTDEQKRKKLKEIKQKMPTEAKADLMKFWLQQGAKNWVALFKNKFSKEWVKGNLRHQVKIWLEMEFGTGDRAAILEGIVDAGAFESD